MEEKAGSSTNTQNVMRSMAPILEALLTKSKPSEGYTEEEKKCEETKSDCTGCEKKEETKSGCTGCEKKGLGLDMNKIVEIVLPIIMNHYLSPHASTEVKAHYNPEMTMNVCCDVMLTTLKSGSTAQSSYDEAICFLSKIEQMVKGLIMGMKLGAQMTGSTDPMITYKCSMMEEEMTRQIVNLRRQMKLK